MTKPFTDKDLDKLRKDIDDLLQKNPSGINNNNFPWFGNMPSINNIDDLKKKIRDLHKKTNNNQLNPVWPSSTFMDSSWSMWWDKEDDISIWDIVILPIWNKKAIITDIELDSFPGWFWSNWFSPKLHSVKSYTTQEIDNEGEILTRTITPYKIWTLTYLQPYEIISKWFYKLILNDKLYHNTVFIPWKEFSLIDFMRNADVVLNIDETTIEIKNKRFKKRLCWL